jgi:hypothetical protein
MRLRSIHHSCGLKFSRPKTVGNGSRLDLNDALSFGVRTIWIIDPYEREAWIATAERGTFPVEDGRLRSINPTLDIDLKEILPED